MYDVSMSIVSYNNKNDIKNLLNSFYKYASRKLSYKIYIINNSQGEKIDELNEYQNVEVIQLSRNLGFGKGHNAVLKQLDSKYHAIINPDILFGEEIFEKIIVFFEKHQDIGMVVPLLTDEQRKILPVYRRELTVWDLTIRMVFKKWFKKRQAWHTMQEMDYTKPFEVENAQGSFLVIKTALYKLLEGFDDRYFMYAEDADLTKRVNEVSKTVMYPEVSAIHKWEKESHRNFKLTRIHMASLAKYFWKWGFKWK